MEITRRHLLLRVAAGAGVVGLIGCGGETNEPVEQLSVNEQFVKILEDHLGIDDASDRKDLDEIAFEKGSDASFMEGVPDIATFENTYGERVTLGTSPRGWPMYEGARDLQVFEYPGKTWTGEVSFDNRKFQILGPEEMVDRYRADATMLSNFLNGFIGDTNAPVSFALNAAPLSQEVVVGDMKVSYPNNYPTGVTFRGGEEHPFYGVLINLNMSHMQSERLGLTLQQGLREVMVNEGVNLASIIEADKRGGLFPSNEAPSTLGGYAAAFNPKWDRFFGGDSFTGMVDLLAQDMASLKE